MISGNFLSVGARTHPGLVRPQNEDAMFADAESGLVIVADGMGGCAAGEVASSMAVQLVSQGLLAQGEWSNSQHHRDDSNSALRHTQIRESVQDANARIFFASQTQPAFSGMGTTLVLAHFVEGQVVVAHVGDSRCYRLREGKFERLTKDHSLIQEMLDRGLITPEEVPFSNARNLVTRALGIGPLIDVDMAEYDALAGDCYLLCTDGLTDMLDDALIGSTLQAYGDDAVAAADRLVDLANEKGGRDNITALVVQVSGEFSPTTTWWQRLLNGMG